MARAPNNVINWSNLPPGLRFDRPSSTVAAIDGDGTLFEICQLYAWSTNDAVSDQLQQMSFPPSAWWRAYERLLKEPGVFTLARHVEFALEEIERAGGKNVDRELLSMTITATVLEMRAVHAKNCFVPGARKALTRLRERGIPIVLVTMGDADWQVGKFFDAGLIELVDLVVVTSTNPEKAEVFSWISADQVRVIAIDNSPSVIRATLEKGDHRVLPHLWLRSYQHLDVPSGVLARFEPLPSEGDIDALIRAGARTLSSWEKLVLG